MNFKHTKPKKIKRISDPFTMKNGNFSIGEISSSQKDNWAESVYMSDSSEKETLGKNFDYFRIPFFVFLISIFLIILLSRSAWLQIVKGDYYGNIADGNRVRIHRLEPKRGIFYDRNYNALVRNSANFMLYAVPIDLPKDEKLDKVFDIVSDILVDIDRDEIENKIKKINRYTLEAYNPIFIKC